MPKTRHQTKRTGRNTTGRNTTGPNTTGRNTLTRQGMKRPKIPRSWRGRVAMRNLAKVLERLDETMAVFEIREDIRAKKRDLRPRPRLKAIKEQRAAEEAYGAACRHRARLMTRDASGRFAAKRTRGAKCTQ